MAYRISNTNNNVQNRVDIDFDDTFCSKTWYKYCLIQPHKLYHDHIYFHTRIQ